MNNTHSTDQINYNGFQIDAQYRIFHNGKQTFTAHHQRCCTMDEAKRMIDTSNAAKVNRIAPINYANALFTLSREEQQERDRQDEEDKINRYYEIQNDNHWDNY